jgi:hypothetical protein
MCPRRVAAVICWRNAAASHSDPGLIQREQLDRGQWQLARCDQRTRLSNTRRASTPDLADWRALLLYDAGRIL